MFRLPSYFTSKPQNMENGKHSDTDIEDPRIPLLAESLEKKLERTRSPSLNAHCIYKVPRQLFMNNELAYTPKFVSVGPIHHGTKDLKDMEEFKHRSLRFFLQRADVRLKEYLKFIKAREERVRDCYVDPIKFDSHDLVVIIATDAAFLIELLLENPLEMASENYMLLVDKPYMSSHIIMDLLLLENQLPLFLLKAIVDHYPGITAQSKISTSGEGFSFTKELCKLIKSWTGITILESDFRHIWTRENEAKHLLDYLWRYHHSNTNQVDPNHIPCNKPSTTPGPTGATSNENGTETLTSVSTPSTTQLSQAGVRFTKSSSSNHLLHITFKRGVLSIPEIYMSDCTEMIFRNLVAYEKCHYPHKTHFSDYFFFMNHLINSAEDIDLLIKSKIMTNTLGDSSKAADVFNSIAQGIGIPRPFYFAEICEKLNAHHDKLWHQWKTVLKKEYFNNPWAIISFIAAIILLVLTVLQTVYTII